jgi:FdhE protein
MKSGKWDARIARARELTSAYPSAKEGLRFFEHIVQFQKSLHGDLEKERGTQVVTRKPGTLREELDLFVLLPRFGPFLSIVEKNAPKRLADAASRLRESGSARWQEVLAKYWQGEPRGEAEPVSVGGEVEAEDDPLPMQLAWMFLQAYAEYLADYTAHAPFNSTPLLCPLCGSKPLAGALRPEGDGGKRSLICSLCATEWDFRRLICAGCGEETVNKLPVYTAKEIAHVRVEACDTCRQYIKTIDTTKDGHALPVVDELATIPLNLWAEEHGYAKVRTNLLGI